MIGILKRVLRQSSEFAQSMKQLHTHFIYRLDLSARLIHSRRKLSSRAIRHSFIISTVVASAAMRSYNFGQIYTFSRQSVIHHLVVLF